jgi:hypothetical protein
VKGVETLGDDKITMTCKKFRRCINYELGRYTCDHAFADGCIDFKEKKAASLEYVR